MIPGRASFVPGSADTPCRIWRIGPSDFEDVNFIQEGIGFPGPEKMSLSGPPPLFSRINEPLTSKFVDHSSILSIFLLSCRDGSGLPVSGLGMIAGQRVDEKGDMV
jgi:hypothetical protein